ncbi:MAG TPA: hypothetical protein VL652_17565 [Kutzneria sp.]|nr:hypothetical protein [Kutzneria sp.]
MSVLIRLAIVATLAETGFVHAKLYLGGYRVIPYIGPMFLLQAAVSFAVAALLLFAAPVVLRLLAAGAAAGALFGFVLSRTVGVFGFIERGFDPAPDALLSVLAEVLCLLLIGVLWAGELRRRRPAL